MYIVEFYENAAGESELWDFLEELRVKSVNSKDARIQYKQISLYIQLLQDNGTRLPENITKHLDEDIWELRPGNNRVFYKHLSVRLTAPKQSVTIISHGRRQKHENME